MREVIKVEKMVLDMSKQENILAFILADQGTAMQYARLNNILISLSEYLSKIDIDPFSFIQRENDVFSFFLEHCLERLEKKGAISQNGSITIENKNRLLDLGYKLDFDTQSAIRKISKSVREDVTVNSKWLFTCDSRQKASSENIYTVGYEGKDIDSFLTNILKKGIENIIDVRCNAVSRKFGFSKKQLSLACNKLKIHYIHIPALGIPSESRQSLKTQKDYDKLFISYTENILPNHIKEQNEVLAIMNEKPSALMCYEENPMQCHRTYLAKSIASKSNKKIMQI